MLPKYKELPTEAKTHPAEQEQTHPPNEPKTGTPKAPYTHKTKQHPV